MEKKNNQSKHKFGKNLIQSDINKTKSDYLKSTSIGKSGLITKNIFLSLPKVDNREKSINKSFLRTLNLTINNKINKTIDSLYKDNFSKYGNSTQKINKNNLKINIIESDKINGYNIPRNNRFTIILGKSPLKTNYKTNSNLNTTFKNTKKKYKKLVPIQQKINKSLEHKNSKAQNIDFFQKKPSVDYISTILKNVKAFKIKEEPDLNKVNVGKMMKKISKTNNNNCLLKDDDKNNNKENLINVKKNFKIGNKFSSEEKIKNLKERNEFYLKIKMLNIGKENKLEKKLGHMNNCHDILEHYKNNRFDNCRKLIEQTLLDVKKEKNIICGFFDNYKKVFDEFDDWNDPKNKDNLYN